MPYSRYSHSPASHSSITRQRSLQHPMAAIPEAIRRKDLRRFLALPAAVTIPQLVSCPSGATPLAAPTLLLALAAFSQTPLTTIQPLARERSSATLSAA